LTSATRHSKGWFPPDFWGLKGAGFQNVDLRFGLHQLMLEISSLQVFSSTHMIMMMMMMMMMNDERRMTNDDDVNQVVFLEGCPKSGLRKLQEKFVNICFDQQDRLKFCKLATCRPLWYTFASL